MKWFLIIIFITVIMLIARALSEQYKEKFDFYYNLKNFLNNFKLNLSFKQEKILEFLKSINSKRQFNMFIVAYKKYLTTNELNLSEIKFLDQEDKSELENIMKNIGNYDAVNEMNQIDNFITLIDSRLVKAEQDKNKLCPMIMKLSLLFAIGIAIILI